MSRSGRRASIFTGSSAAIRKGIWPSEGGISRAVGRGRRRSRLHLRGHGREHPLEEPAAAYDRKALFKPHRAEDLTVFFRDRELSDLIGFEYQHWNAKDAVADLLRRLDERRSDCDEDSIVVLALDGENPWGTFPENGLPFLRELYARLSSHPGIDPTFFEDYLARRAPAPEIPFVPGTWLGNFSKWSGSPAKNRGWEILARARKACGPSEEILIAEGSDWFWWFGEEHTEEFAFLFDLYIEAAYRRAGNPMTDAPALLLAFHNHQPVGNFRSVFEPSRGASKRRSSAQRAADERSQSGVCLARILVVDDETSMQEFLQILLPQRDGHDVERVRLGLRGVGRARERRLGPGDQRRAHAGDVGTRAARPGAPARGGDDHAKRIGDPILLEAEFRDVDEQTVSNLFGAEFAHAIFSLKPGSWSGPVQSGYGVHLVRIIDFNSAALRPFDEVRSKVLEE